MENNEISTQGVETTSTESGTQNYDAVIAELNATIKELKSENAKRRIENKQQTEKFEAEKNQVLTEQGQFKELYEKTLNKVKELENYVSYKEKYEALETLTKQQLLEQIPQSRRKEYESFPIDVLQVVVKDITVKPTASVGTEGNGTITAESTWEQLNDNERDNLFRTNPTLANQLMQKAIMSTKYY